MLARGAIALALIAITWTVYGQVRGFDFVGIDDAAYTTEHPWFYDGLSMKNVRRVFSEPYYFIYTPLTALSYFADYERAGTDPSAYHLTNLLFHVANSILLFLVLGRLTGRLWPSAFVASLFAIHPLHVESVAWVSERKDVLSTFFAWLALGAYAWYARRPKLAAYIFVVVLFIAGLLSKPMLVTLPCVMLLLDFWPLERAALQRADARQWARLVVEKLPLLALSAAASAATILIQREAMPGAQILSLSDRLSNAFVAYVRYLINTFWPAELIPHYPHPKGTLAFWQVGGAALVLVAVTAAAWRLRKRAPYLLVGWLWYLGTLVPVIGIVQAGGQAMADRYTYIPLVGIFLAVAWGAADLLKSYPRWRTPVAAAAAAVIAVLSVLAHRQAANWRDSTALFEHTLRVDPDNPLGLGVLGAAYVDRGRLDEAVTLLERAIEVDPRSLGNRLNLARAYRKLGRLDAAEGQLETAFDLGYDSPRIHDVFALVLMDRGKLEEAREHLETAIETDPGYLDAYVHLGNVWLRREQPGEAIAAYRRVLDRNPRHVEALNNLGVAQLLNGDAEAAARRFREALALSPDDAEARTNLAAALYELGQIDAARREVAAALRLDPDNRKARALQETLEASQTSAVPQAP